MPPLRTAITIGNFDGVHAGHQALVRRAREVADVGGTKGRVIAMTFDPHPAIKTRPEAAPARLSIYDRRARLLEEAGADEVVRLTPDDQLLSKSPEEFVRWLVWRYKPSSIVEGQDFCFGRGRAGNITSLAAMGKEFAFEVSIVDPVEVSLSNHLAAPASSTLVRWLLMQGRVGDAALVLGRPYELPGTVLRGDRRGRLLGFPTANLSTECLIPADGVYAGEALLPDGRTFHAAVSIGARPTFNGTGRRAEVHLLEVPRAGDCIEGLAEYGWQMSVRLLAWVRDDVRFESVQTLVAQMGRDCQRVRMLVGSPVASRPHHEPKLVVGSDVDNDAVETVNAQKV